MHCLCIFHSPSHAGECGTCSLRAAFRVSRAVLFCGGSSVRRAGPAGAPGTASKLSTLSFSLKAGRWRGGNTYPPLSTYGEKRCSRVPCSTPVPLEAPDAMCSKPGPPFCWNAGTKFMEGFIVGHRSASVAKQERERWHERWAATIDLIPLI